MDGIADVLGIGCDNGAENDDTCSASFVFFHVWRHGRHRFVAAKQRRCNRCNVSLWHWLKRGFRSWHRLLWSSWQRSTDFLSFLHKLVGIGQNQTVECCWACHVSVSTGFSSRSMDKFSEACISRRGGTGGARRASSIGPSGNCSDAVACRT